MMTDSNHVHTALSQLLDAVNGPREQINFIPAELPSALHVRQALKDPDAADLVKKFGAMAISEEQQLRFYATIAGIADPAGQQEKHPNLLRVAQVAKEGFGEICMQPDLPAQTIFMKTPFLFMGHQGVAAITGLKLANDKPPAHSDHLSPSHAARIFRGWAKRVEAGVAGPVVQIRLESLRNPTP